MSYDPDQNRDIRGKWIAEKERYVITQQRTRYANGSTDPNDLGSITDLGAVGWEVRHECRGVAEMLEELFNIAYQEDVIVREVDLDRIDPLSPAVVAAVQRMQLLTL